MITRGVDRFLYLVDLHQLYSLSISSYHTHCGVRGAVCVAPRLCSLHERRHRTSSSTHSYSTYISIHSTHKHAINRPLSSTCQAVYRPCSFVSIAASHIGVGVDATHMLRAVVHRQPP